MRVDPDEVIRDTASSVPSAEELLRLREEFRAVRDELDRRIQSRNCRYPVIWGMGGLSLYVLYSLVRLEMPKVVVETGVANGVSTMVLLHAMGRNGGGSLHSFDVSADVGGILDPVERRDWDLHVIDGGAYGRRERFLKALHSVSPAQLLIHDSEHGYRWQRFEYESFARWAAPRAIIASDDVDSSYAFLDFCQAHRSSPCFLFDHLRVFGLTRLVGGGTNSRD